MIVSNTTASHGSKFAQLLNPTCTDIFWVSPYLASDFKALFADTDFSSVNQVVLVTALKANDQDQITKPKALKSFIEMVRSKTPKVAIRIHIDNSLHGKIYVFEGNERRKAIVTSANLTHNGLFHNNEWGVELDTPESIDKLKNEVLECIEYVDVTESMIDRLIIHADQHERERDKKRKEAGQSENSIEIESDILKEVYHQADNSNREPRYYLKPIGVSEDPIYKESKRDFSALHQDLAFSKKGTGRIEAGDIVITTAVGCGCLLSYFKVTGSPVEASYEEQKNNINKSRWPWSMEGRNQSTNYGAAWFEYNLDRKNLLDDFLSSQPDSPVTAAGSRTLGTISFGADKVEISKVFAEFLIKEIERLNA